MDEFNVVNPIERYLVDKANMMRIPINATFELTPYCNLRCDMCYVRMDKKDIIANGGLLDLDQWLQIAQQLKKMGTLFILLTGGEPLLYPHFKDLYVKLREMGFILTMNTNATLLTDDVAQLLSEHKPRRVNVTLYGGSDETYHKLCHVQNGYTRCIQGLERLKQYGIDARLNLTILKKNQADFSSLVVTADRLGIPSMKNCYMSVHCRKTCSSQLDIPSQRMSPEDVARFELEHVHHEKGEDFKEYLQLANQSCESDSIIPKGIGLTCRAGTSSCWINWQGTLTPCVDMEEPGVSLLEYPVADAWHTIVKACELLPYHTECSGCKLKSICDVCYANASNEKMHCGSINYLCEVAKAKQQQIHKLLNEYNQ